MAALEHGETTLVDFDEMMDELRAKISTRRHSSCRGT
jgi:hypothetical protein